VAWAARGFVDGMRCVPFLLFAYIIYYGFPSLGVRLDNWTSGLLALTIYKRRLHGGDPAWCLGGAAPRADRGRHRLRILGSEVVSSPHSSAAVARGRPGDRQPDDPDQSRDSAFLTIIALPELTHAASSIQSRHYVPFACLPLPRCFSIGGLCLVIEAGVSSIGRVADARR